MSAAAAQHPLYQAVSREAIAQGQSFGITGWLQTILAWVLATGRSEIDTPEKRAIVEGIAIQAFNTIVGPTLSPLILAAVDGTLTNVLDKLLTSIAGQ